MNRTKLLLHIFLDSCAALDMNAVEAEDEAEKIAEALSCVNLRHVDRGQEMELHKPLSRIPIN